MNCILKLILIPLTLPSPAAIRSVDVSKPRPNAKPIEDEIHWPH